MARAAPALLLHVNVLLTRLAAGRGTAASAARCPNLYAGALLLTAARLKWDPTLYVAARELFPAEYRAAAAALPALAAALLLLAHLALAAARARRALRRRLLVLHGCGQLLAAGGWAALGGWAWLRMARWAGGPAAAELRRTLELREHLLPLLEHLAHYHPLPERITALLQEAEADLPRTAHALAAAAALLALLQLLAAALALRGACDARDARDAHDAPSGRAAVADVDRAPLRVAYRRGRLVPL